MEYRYWGDLTFDTANANYTLTGNKIFLTYYPIKIDTTDWPELRKHGVTMMEQELNKYGKTAPSGLLIRGDKLFLYDKNGLIVKKKSDSKNKRRKYFLIKH